tara:strand:- start:288 stop:506 length:219 start_codon:yes stop_codon:yes gene_type:complete
MEVASQDPALLAVIGGIVVIVFGFLAYGIYASFGPGSKELRDTIDEHARMHELGIAHGHSPKDKHNPARSLF